jgi:hypothetical protein
MKLVKKMNHLLRWPFLSSPVDSAHATDPAGLEAVSKSSEVSGTGPLTTLHQFQYQVGSGKQSEQQISLECCLQHHSCQLPAQRR